MFVQTLQIKNIQLENLENKSPRWISYFREKSRLVGDSFSKDFIDRATKQFYLDPENAPLADRLIEDFTNFDNEETWLNSFGESLNLDKDFFSSFFEALSDWEQNQTKTETWITTFNTTTLESSSTSPYFDSVPTKPVVNFFVTKITGFYGKVNNKYYLIPAFKNGINVRMYFPNLISSSQSLVSNTSQTTTFIAPKLSSLTAIYHYARGIKKLYIYAPLATSLNHSAYSAISVEYVKVYAPKATDIYYFLANSHGAARNIKEVYLDVQNIKLLRDCCFNYSLGLNKLIINNGCPLATSIHRMCRLNNGVVSNNDFYISFNKDYITELSFPSAEIVTESFQGRKKFNQYVLIPKAKNVTNAFLDCGLNSINISKTLDSLPKWTDGETHTITFTNCPGQVSTATTETFSVTGSDGVEYSYENCPYFDNDDSNMTLRKSFVLAIKEKGWTVEISTPIDNTSISMLSLIDEEETSVIPKYFKLTECEEDCADVVDSNGKFYLLHETGMACGPNGENVGYSPFNSREDCLSEWGLEEYQRDLVIDI